MPAAGTSPRRIYLDHAATTPLRQEVLEAMRPFLGERFGNPSSLHAEGRDARSALEEARAAIRAACGARELDLVFCSSGTEADNAALVGAFLAARGHPRWERKAARRVVTSAVEHPAVLNALPLLEELGGAVTAVGVDEEGRVDVSELVEALEEDACLASLMAANNETGTLEPIEAAGWAARERGIAFHVDAVQALGKLPLRLDELPADLVTVSAHKIEGPRGIAGLFVRRGTPFEPFLRGGSQEGGLRAGTENVAAAVGFARAVELAASEREASMLRLGALRDALRRGIAERFPEARVNTPERGALSTALNVSFPWVEGESLVMLLDTFGVAASTGSACNAGARKPSHVLHAMGRSPAEVRGSLRLTFGRTNVEADLEPVLEALERAVRQLERIAPARR
ncbi:MAG: cysteine desulfurase [Planctomycetes bacterium]|nr:cysteine desulfurase [Planctomycetota bacterium]